MRREHEPQVDFTAALTTLNQSLDFGMTVVTAAAFGEVTGCLVGFQGQASIDPLLWGVWIAKVNHSFPVVTTSDTVAIHFLTDNQHELADHFGSLSGDDTDKFRGIELDGDSSLNGAPLIAACPNRIVGRRVDVLHGPTDHSCVLVEPHTIECASSFRPLRISDVSDVHPGHPLHS